MGGLEFGLQEARGLLEDELVVDAGADGQVHGHGAALQRQRPHVQAVDAGYAVQTQQLAAQLAVLDAPRNAWNTKNQRSRLG